MRTYSPIVALHDWIAASPFSIAPEHASQLSTLDETHNFEIVFHDKPGFRVAVNPDTKIIHISNSALELLWSASLAYLVVTQEYEYANRAGRRALDLGAIPRCKRAIDLYEWSLHNNLSAQLSAWPNPEVCPKKIFDGGDIHCANELFLCAIAWILHHEIAHVELRHQEVSARSQDDEREADIFATRWVVCQARSDELKKRTLGLVVALLVLTAMDFKRGQFPAVTHPRSFERLLYCLDRVDIDENHPLFAFSLIIVQLHMSAAGMTLPVVGANSSFRTLVEEHAIAAIRAYRDN